MSDADENVNALSIPCRMDERGVLPAANLSVHRCAPAAEMVPVPAGSGGDRDACRCGFVAWQATGAARGGLELFVCKVFTLTTALECLWVAVCIVREGLRQGGEAGTLDNPAELSLHLCVVLPMTGWLLVHSEGWKWRLAYGAAAVLSAAVLWLTQSRTGLICLALYGIIGLGLVVRRSVHRRCLRWGLHGAVVVAMLAGTSAYVTFRKTDSTSGRAFILSRSWELVKEHPIIGHGHRGFEREYMLRQADFFKENPDSEYAVLADEIRHPLNEFLYVWVNYGVAAPVALLLLLLLPLWRWLRGDRKMSPFLLPMTAILVFSFFSYPFYYPIAWLTVGVSVLYAIRRALNRWQQRKVFPYLLLVLSLTVIGFTMNDALHEHGWYRAYRHSFREDSALMEYEDLYPYFRRNHVLCSFTAMPWHPSSARTWTGQKS